MKRTPPDRNTPLKRGKPLKRTGRLSPVSDSRRREQRKRREVLEELVEERGSLCEAKLDGCNGRAVDGHELLPRGRGGDPTDRNNIALLCRSCHRFVTENPAWAEDNGWLEASG